jgi:hypothetical protein
MFTNIFHFFTIWIFILTIFNKYTSKYFNLPYLSLIVLVLGSYLSFIHPKYYKIVIFHKTIKIKGIARFILADIIFHMGVFLYNYKMFGFNNNNIRLSIMLFIVYLFFVDFDKIYKIKN